MRLSEKLLEKTKRVWGGIYGRPISDEEALEITQNIIEFFRALKYLEEKVEASHAKTFSHHKTI